MIGKAPSSGKLSEYPFVQLLQQVEENSFTGVLVLIREEVKKSLFFCQGKIVSARSNLPQESLVSLLLGKGLLKSSQFKEVSLELQGKEPLQQGELLLQKGWLDPMGLNQILQEQLQNRLEEIFSWPEGKFGFLDQLPPETIQTPCEKSLMEMALKGLRKKFENSFKPQRISFQSLPSVEVPKNLEASFPFLKARELGFLRAMDGKKTFQEILKQTKTEEKSITPFLQAMKELGAVKWREESQKNLGSVSSEKITPSSGFLKKGTKEEYLKFFQTLKGKDFFEILGVSRTANTSEIKEAYFSLAKQYHPDRLPQQVSPEEKKEFEDGFAKISEAQSVLINENSRKEYEISLEMEQKGVNDESGMKILQSELEFQKAAVLIRKGDFAGAIQLLSTAIQLYDQEPEYFAFLGWAVYRQASKVKNSSEMTKGKKLIEKAVSQSDRSDQAFFYLGLIEKAEGNMAKAKQHFLKAIEISPKFQEALSEIRMIERVEEKTSKKKGLFN